MLKSNLWEGGLYADCFGTLAHGGQSRMFLLAVTGAERQVDLPGLSPVDIRHGSFTIRIGTAGDVRLQQCDAGFRVVESPRPNSDAAPVLSIVHAEFNAL